jgi:hypothetical protein
MKPREKFYLIKVDQTGPTLYIHYTEEGDYAVKNTIIGAALWRDEAAAILWIKGAEELNPGRKFKLERFAIDKRENNVQQNNDQLE